MRNIHLFMPFSRHELWPKLLEAYRPMNVILHPLTFVDEATVECSEKWVQPFVSKMKRHGAFGVPLHNAFIKQFPLVDDDYYCQMADDDMYEPGVFDAIRKIDFPVVIISMKRGHHVPEGVSKERRYPTETLDACPENTEVQFVGGEQVFIKGSVLRTVLYDETNPATADGLMAEHLKTICLIHYEPDLFALFNYYEPGRWDKKEKIEDAPIKQKTNRLISNRLLGIGIPCTFPLVPSSFFYSYALMEKPDHMFLHSDIGEISVLRNDLVEKALAEKCTHLIMMDVDQIYPVNTIAKLLSHRLPVVGCRVHRRYPPFDSLMMKIEKVNETTNCYNSIDDWKEGELIEVDATGGGCLMFSMEVFRKIPYPWFESKAKEGGPGEDFGFCQKLKAVGYKIYVDSSLECGHLTTMVINRKTNLLYRSMKDKQKKKNLEKALKNNE